MKTTTDLQKEIMTELEENLRIAKDGSIEQKGELRVNGSEPVEQWRRPHLHELLAFIDKSMQRVAESAREEGKRQIIAELESFMNQASRVSGMPAEACSLMDVFGKTNFDKFRPSPQQESEEGNG